MNMASSGRASAAKDTANFFTLSPTGDEPLAQFAHQRAESTSNGQLS